jgi:Pyruvate/2-oxoacid:ferredoxin oxidoreductase delta subunit
MRTETSGGLPKMEAHDLMKVQGTGRKTAPDAGKHVRRSKKCIPPELRRRPFRSSLGISWFRRLLRRLKEDSQAQRSFVQLTFVLLCLWIGVEFYSFVRWGLGGASHSFYPRPPGVEGFLPISALISLKYFVTTGIVNAVHPSALFILIAVLAVSMVVKKAFCSWLCPIGTLSESLWLLGQKLFGRNLDLPRWLDLPLRALKYILLAFFLWSIMGMDTRALEYFIYSPYNKVADIKMYLFFARISGLALGTIVVLAFLSVIVRNFWCRYLCPYGALLGLVSLVSPFRITRNKDSCIDCMKCTESCPARIKVHATTRVWSDECTSCMACVQVCPVKNALNLQLARVSKPVPNWVLGTLILGVFMAITGFAMITGHWQNGISRYEYQRRFLHLEDPQYQHFRGHVAEYGPDD